LLSVSSATPTQTPLTAAADEAPPTIRRVVMNAVGQRRSVSSSARSAEFNVTDVLSCSGWKLVVATERFVLFEIP
jgi:hypothetical protein